MAYQLPFITHEFAINGRWIRVSLSSTNTRAGACIARSLIGLSRLGWNFSGCFAVLASATKTKDASCWRAIINKQTHRYAIDAHGTSREIYEGGLFSLRLSCRLSPIRNANARARARRPSIVVSFARSGLLFCSLPRGVARQLDREGGNAFGRRSRRV